MFSQFVYGICLPATSFAYASTLGVFIITVISLLLYFRLELSAT